MEIINNIKTQISEISWTTDNVTLALIVATVTIFLLSLLQKGGATRSFTSSVFTELKKIDWLKRKDVLRFTFAVILISAAAIAIMTPLDALFVELKKTYLFN